jgi:hypothetical protein
VLSPESNFQKSFGQLRPASPFVNSIIGTLRRGVKARPNISVRTHFALKQVRDLTAEAAGRDRSGETIPLPARNSRP